jgi:putative iron-only hydrogenase system regulator
MAGERRLGAVAIVIEDREQAAPVVNEILSSYAEIIIGRLGVPYHEKNVSVICLVVDGTADEVGALAGKIGGIAGVKVKSALTSR